MASLPTVPHMLAKRETTEVRPRQGLSQTDTMMDGGIAGASAKHVLAELQERGLVPDQDSGLSPWMNATSTPTPTWQKSGSAKANQ
jgi:hypothetical protein